jgi:hypothetical protein
MNYEESTMIRITLEQEKVVWNSPKRSSEKDAFLDNLLVTPKSKSDTISESGKTYKGSNSKLTDCSSSYEPRNIDDLIPELENDFHGKGRNAELPTFLDMDDSRTLEELLGVENEEEIAMKVPMKKRTNKAEIKLDYNKEVDELLKLDDTFLHPIDVPI